MRSIAVLAGVAVIATPLSKAVEAESSAAPPSPYAVLETYRQKIVIEPADGTADLGVPVIAPVYDGHRWALSTRWDDSNPNALNIRAKMLENGIRGTFYLNSRQPEQDPASSLARKLTGNGECSVGGHSATHPHLPKLPANDVFRELMSNRIALEVLTDRPVNSLAFPYGGYQDKERPEVMQAITEAVLRSGYHHCTYQGFVMHNPNLPAGLVSTGLQVVPGDREVNQEKFWASVEKINKFESGYRKVSDEIFLGVHPWQKGQALEDLGTVMGKLRTWDDFWHCTQTEFAAYTKQRRNTAVEPVAGGRFVIQRPAAFEIGSDIPLTLVFDSDAIRAATVDGLACTVRHAGGKSYVNVPHNPKHGIPVVIEEAGAGAEFAGLKTTLAVDDDTDRVLYTLLNESGKPVTDAVLTVSLPPALEPGLVRNTRHEIANAAMWEVTSPVVQKHTEEYWCSGNRYVAAQLDFVLDGRRGRLFTTVNLPVR